MTTSPCGQRVPPLMHDSTEVQAGGQTLIVNVLDPVFVPLLRHVLALERPRPVQVNVADVSTLRDSAPIGPTS